MEAPPGLFPELNQTDGCPAFAKVAADAADGKPECGHPTWAGLLSQNQTEGAQSLRSSQGWEAMLPIRSGPA